MFPTRCSKNDDSVCILVRDMQLEERNVNRALIIAFHRGVKKNTSKRYWRKKKKIEKEHSIRAVDYCE